MLLNPSGGFYYHWAAYRHRLTRWRSFRTQLNLWLTDWKPPLHKLLLIGPSAGYCLSTSFINQFEEVDVVEIDPLARLFCQFRFDRWHTKDYFEPVDGNFSLQKLDQLFKDFPEHTIVFCNLLGQIPLLYPKASQTESFRQWKKYLSEKLRARDFASFHDRFSGNLEFQLSALDFLGDLEPSRAELTLESPASFEGIFKLSKIFPEKPASSSGILSKIRPKRIKSKTQIFDHLTQGLFPGFQKKYLNWEIRPKQHHLIELVRS